MTDTAPIPDVSLRHAIVLLGEASAELEADECRVSAMMARTVAEKLKAGDEPRHYRATVSILEELAHAAGVEEARRRLALVEGILEAGF